MCFSTYILESVYKFQPRTPVGVLPGITLSLSIHMRTDKTASPNEHDAVLGLFIKEDSFGQYSEICSIHSSIYIFRVSQLFDVFGAILTELFQFQLIATL